jgi:hypothetical protein
MTTPTFPAFERIGLHEGTIGLPPGFEDRTANMFVPSDPQNQPNLSIARDWLAASETLTTYVDRQLQVLKSRLPNHKLIARVADRLGDDDVGLVGERIEAQYKNGTQTVRQRQAAFLVGPKRALILTAASPRPFDANFETLWRGWLDSFVQASQAEGDSAPVAE